MWFLFYFVSQIIKTYFYFLEWIIYLNHLMDLQYFTILALIGTQFSTHFWFLSIICLLQPNHVADINFLFSVKVIFLYKLWYGELFLLVLNYSSIFSNSWIDNIKIFINTIIFSSELLLGRLAMDIEINKIS